MTKELFPLLYRDPLTGKWVKARYVAERHEVAARYKEWETRGRRKCARAANQITSGHSLQRRRQPSNVDRSPMLDDAERFLARVFLRRYVIYCARRRWFAQLEGAARLAQALAGGCQPIVERGMERGAGALDGRGATGFSMKIS